MTNMRHFINIITEATNALEAEFIQKWKGTIIDMHPEYVDADEEPSDEEILNLWNEAVDDLDQLNGEKIYRGIKISNDSLESILSGESGVGMFWSFSERQAKSFTVGDKGSYDQRYDSQGGDLKVIFFATYYGDLDVDYVETIGQRIINPDEQEVKFVGGSEIFVTKVIVNGKTIRIDKNILI